MAKPVNGNQLILTNMLEFGGVVGKEMAKVDFENEDSKQAFFAGVLLTLFMVLVIVFFLAMR